MEESIVKCLEYCAEYNYPISRQGVKEMVQSYCIERGVNTR